MADAALPVARQALGLPGPDTLVRSEPEAGPLDWLVFSDVHFAKRFGFHGRGLRP